VLPFYEKRRITGTFRDGFLWWRERSPKTILCIVVLEVAMIRSLAAICAIAATFAFATPARAATAPDECDRLAAHPADAEKPATVTGTIDIAQQDIAPAIRACKEALAVEGAPRRMWTQLGRALEFASRDEEAAAAYRKSSELGSPLGMASYAVLLIKGQGVAQDFDAARALLEKAAALGDSLAMSNLGSMYGAGIGVKADFVAARGWYEKAAAAGSGEAMYQLGLMAQDGDGATKDEAAAKSWFEKAAVTEHPAALFSLGTYAEEGRAGAKDIAAAIEYYKRAAAFGDEEAQAALERLRCPFTLNDNKDQPAGSICFNGK
jgi:uncharacterized protein